MVSWKTQPQSPDPQDDSGPFQLQNLHPKALLGLSAQKNHGGGEHSHELDSVWESGCLKRPRAKGIFLGERGDR